LQIYSLSSHLSYFYLYTKRKLNPPRKDNMKKDVILKKKKKRKSIPDSDSDSDVIDVTLHSNLCVQHSNVKSTDDDEGFRNNCVNNKSRRHRRVSGSVDVLIGRHTRLSQEEDYGSEDSSMGDFIVDDDDQVFKRPLNKKTKKKRNEKEKSTTTTKEEKEKKKSKKDKNININMKKGCGEGGKRRRSIQESDSSSEDEEETNMNVEKTLEVWTPQKSVTKKMDDDSKNKNDYDSEDDGADEDDDDHGSHRACMMAMERENDEHFYRTIVSPLSSSSSSSSSPLISSPIKNQSIQDKFNRFIDLLAHVADPINGSNFLTKKSLFGPHTALIDAGDQIGGSLCTMVESQFGTMAWKQTFREDIRA